MVRIGLSVLGRPAVREEPARRSRPRGLVDSFGRVIRDLRLGITDRCNFRCVYCMEPDARFLETEQLLTPAELVRLARLCMGLGVQHVRITGGEPTVHPHLNEIIAGVAALSPADLSMTTNGALCTRGRLEEWRSLGLRRITFSLDSVSESSFAAMTRSRSTGARIIGAIADAIAAGLGPVKVNAVVLRGRNEAEIGPLTLLARELGFEMRFIEYMPLDSGRRWDRSLLVPAGEILERACAAAALEPTGRVDPSATAETYRFADGSPGRIGIIAPVTRAFCGRCSRLRITGDGKVRPCLFSLDEFDVRDAMRAGENDREIEDRLLDAVWSKQAGHGIGESGFEQPPRAMHAIGG